ncbi:hypothetical protein R1flu_026999 [Riccia fluitans]|uniref:Uncharacterized protein n=1 Tax=Riccia fluitans TaxID=41844 RepID=A0ABD1XKK4_9MARC
MKAEGEVASGQSKPGEMQNCSALKMAYNECFNRWYTDKFLKGQWDKEECQAEWEAYRACLSETEGVIITRPQRLTYAKSVDYSTWMNRFYELREISSVQYRNSLNNGVGSFLYSNLVQYLGKFLLLRQVLISFNSVPTIREDRGKIYYFGGNEYFRTRVFKFRLREFS